MIKKKKLIAVIMLTVIIITAPLTSYRKAEASGLGGLLAYPIGVAGGITVGGAVCIALAAVAVGLGIELLINNSDELVKRFENYVNSFGTNDDKLFMQTLKSEAVHKETGLPIEDDVEASYFDYIATKRKYAITPSLKAGMVNFIENEYGGTEVGTYGLPLDVSVKLAIETNFPYSYSIEQIQKITNRMDLISQVCSSYDNVIVCVQNQGYLGGNYQYTATIYAFNGNPYIHINSSDGYARVTSDEAGYYKMEWGLYSTKDWIYERDINYYGSVINAYVGKTKNETVPLSIENVMKLRNCDIPVINSSGQYTGYTYYNTWQEPFTINPSKVKYDDTGFFDKTNTLDISNPHLVDEMIKADADEISTDKIMTLVDNAAQEAQKESDVIIDVPIESPADEVDTGFLSGWLDKLIDKLKEMLEWLFVPDTVALENIVDDVEQKLSNQMGVLTYPIALVIRFLTEFLSLESEECIITLPEIRMPGGYLIYEGYDFNFTNYITQAGFTGYYNLYLMIVRTILILQFLSYAIKKGDEVFKGGIAHDS